MSSAMLRLMQAMKMITGYNEAQTLEQNIVLSGRPLEATLRFGYLGISRNPPTIDIVWRRFDTRSADGTTVQTEESEFQASDEAILQMDESEEGIEAAAKPDVSPKEMRELDERSIALCIDFWSTCFAFVVTGHGYAVAAIDPVMRPKTVVGRPDSPNNRFHPMLNLRLDDVYVGLQSKEYTKELREELKDITKLEKSTRITITNETLLIHAILTRLTNVNWLPLKPEELKRNLDNPLRNLLYRNFGDETTPNTSTAGTRKRSRPEHETGPGRSKKQEKSKSTVSP
ncbi:hypothetical protein C8R42DRAFT_687143 [Lentinula raphanica]|nr:hypothetical protein C8R42DRAFT_687143 [Lentinula raphanica]